MLPSAIGSYRILREVGRGGMGMVYAARDVRLGRDVAIKILRGTPSDEETERFRREARLAAQLRHPRIVSVFDVGIHQGSPFIVMPLVDGESLATRRLPRRSAVALMASVADAVHYAHEMGVVHRDLKPENILVDSEGRGSITDFGLARDLRHDSSLTASGLICGTPAFMSPEQARGEAHRVDRRCDVWGLGATLYFALTQRLPFPGSTAFDVMRTIREEDPDPLRSSDPKIHPDLEAICRKALEKRPERRYADAREFADDLRRFLAGRPTTARLPGLVERAVRWFSRRRAVIAATAAIALFAGGLWFSYSAGRREGVRVARVVGSEPGPETAVP